LQKVAGYISPSGNTDWLYSPMFLALILGFSFF